MYRSTHAAMCIRCASYLQSVLSDDRTSPHDSESAVLRPVALLVAEIQHFGEYRSKEEGEGSEGGGWEEDSCA